jgi:hypothetical protein
MVRREALLVVQHGREVEKLNLKKWIRYRWTEMRWGFGNYLSLAVTFANFVLLVALKFDIQGIGFALLTVGLFVSLSSVSVVFGFLHRRYQQDTDALLTYKAVIDETAKRVVKLLKEEKLV